MTSFSAFAPREEMRLYGRGIRRRLAPMLEGDRRRIELAYALQFSLPGTPALRYGEEIGMGEDLSLDGREAIRTPMQWDGTPNAGFSPAAPEDLFRPVVMSGRFGAENVNVRRQQQNPDSLLRWFENLIHTLRTAPEIGTGSCSVIDASCRARCWHIDSTPKPGRSCCCTIWPTPPSRSILAHCRGLMAILTTCSLTAHTTHRPRSSLT